MITNLLYVIKQDANEICQFFVMGRLEGNGGRCRSSKGEEIVGVEGEYIAGMKVEGEQQEWKKRGSYRRWKGEKEEEDRKK